MHPQKFGRLTVIAEAGKDRHKKRLVRCKCDCGNEVVVNYRSLKTGNTTSCGCFHKEVIRSARTHGMTRSKLYNTWRAMKDRCLNPKATNFPNYGGRGITVCDEWLDSEKFINWALRNGYEDGLTLDRIDNNGPYCPENCRWVSRLTQSNNKRNNRLLEFNRKIATVTEWARITGISEKTIRGRLANGWPIERVLTVPVGAVKTGPTAQLTLTFNGETKNIIEWSEIVGISYDVILGRIKRGWSAEDALTKPILRTAK